MALATLVFDSATAALGEVACSVLFLWLLQDLQLIGSDLRWKGDVEWWLFDLAVHFPNRTVL